ncbi:acyl carrier protein [Streptomyces rhizosphaericus]|uniref:acyl carrier protein n=1 Tax=Streptomyces rhizosphaericus TaxID=114699 RepID=UPI000A36344F|nr:acyl carrier protein [Streptomyces rhizosphaericus]
MATTNPATTADAAHETDELRSWLVGRVAEHLRMAPEEVEPDVPLSDYGLDSLYALSVVAEIEDHLGFAVDETVMWDNPTIDALLGALAEERTRAGAA